MDPQYLSPGDLLLVAQRQSLEEIMTVLAQRGCADLTSLINLDACSILPLCGGGFCDVFRGKLRNNTRIAIKSLRVYDKPGRDDDKQKILKRAAREIYHWSKLDHCNVLPLMGIAIFRGNMSMVSEWMDNGDLMSYIRLNPDVNRMSLCTGVCEGLCYIHARDMAHGDLKAANVMVSHSGTPLIVDFGNSQLKDLTLKFTNTTSHSHSVRWTAPELLSDDNGPHTSKAADVYAYGMMVLEVMTGEVPFYGISDHRVIVSVVVENRIPSRPKTAIGDDLWCILTRCWTREPNERPTIASVGDQVRALVPVSLYKDKVRFAGDKSEAGRPGSATELGAPAQAELIKKGGNEFFRKGQYDLAIEKYSKAIAMDPNEPTYLMNRAASYMAIKKFAPALTDCQAAAELQSASPVPKTLLRLARCHLALGDTPACLAALRDLPDSTPGVANVRRRADQLELHLQQFKDARDKDEWGAARLALEQAVEALEGDVPVQWRCWALEGMVAEGNWADAQQTVSLALQGTLNSPDLLSLRGLILFLTNQIPEAIQQAQQALQYNPAHKSARQLLKRAWEVEQTKEEGNTFFKAGRLGEAVERYGEALEVIGERVSEGGGGHLRAVLLSNRAIAHFKLKQLEPALADTNASLALNPKSYKTMRTRARIHTELEHFEDAVRNFKAAQELAKSGGAPHNELGSLAEETKKAEVLLERSNHYKILNVREDCTSAEIRSAYMRASRIYHPSRGGDEERFKLIGQAYAVLSDSQQRGEQKLQPAQISRVKDQSEDEVGVQCQNQ